MAHPSSSCSGFSVAHSREQRMVPEKVDLSTGAINCRTENWHKFRITFDKASEGYM